ncbi:hypothetical protein LTR50_006277 [Elasticomyces elasticus]|nr:hypothetical protein LTR50_006277 [Elasticomyces elasticus]
MPPSSIDGGALPFSGNANAILPPVLHGLLLRTAASCRGRADAFANSATQVILQAKRSPIRCLPQQRRGRSAKSDLVNDNGGIDGDERYCVTRVSLSPPSQYGPEQCAAGSPTSHQRPHGGYQIHDLGLHARGVLRAAETGVGRRQRRGETGGCYREERTAREEAVFGEDGYCVDEEEGDWVAG